MISEKWNVCTEPKGHYKTAPIPQTVCSPCCHQDRYSVSFCISVCCCTTRLWRSFCPQAVRQFHSAYQNNSSLIPSWFFINFCVKSVGLRGFSGSTQLFLLWQFLILNTLMGESQSMTWELAVATVCHTMDEMHFTDITNSWLFTSFFVKWSHALNQFFLYTMTLCSSSGDT